MNNKNTHDIQSVSEDDNSSSLVFITWKNL